VVKVLNTAKVVAQSQGDMLLNEAVEAYNDKFTDLINDIIQNKISIDLSIDSFIEDIGGTPAYLSEKFGEQISILFNYGQERLIRSVTYSVRDEIRDTVTEDLLGIEPSKELLDRAIVT